MSTEVDWFAELAASGAVTAKEADLLRWCCVTTVKYEETARLDGVPVNVPSTAYGHLCNRPGYTAEERLNAMRWVHHGLAAVHEGL